MLQQQGWKKGTDMRGAKKTGQVEFADHLNLGESEEGKEGAGLTLRTDLRMIFFFLIWHKSNLTSLTITF